LPGVHVCYPLHLKALSKLRPSAGVVSAVATARLAAEPSSDRRVTLAGLSGVLTLCASSFQNKKAAGGPSHAWEGQSAALLDLDEARLWTQIGP
jgi:hypothetical protein